MSEISISKKEFRLSCCVVLQFFFFLLSHPLYFSYFIFFFPYFLKLLSFLSPLFITTFLLLFSFFSLFLSSSSHLHPHSVPQFAENSQMGFLATTYQVVFDSLRPRMPDEIDEFRPVDELEAYKIVFETYTFGADQNPYGGENSAFIVPEVEVNVDCGESMENFPGKILDVEVDSEESMENFPGKMLDVEVDSQEWLKNFPGKMFDVEVNSEKNLPRKILDVEVISEESMENLPGKFFDIEVDSEESMEYFPGEILEVEVDSEESMEYFTGKILEVEVDSEESIENFPGKILDVEVEFEESMENKVDSEESMGKILDVEVDSEESMEYFPGKIIEVEVDSEESTKNFPEETNIFPENPSPYKKVAEIEAKTEEYEIIESETKESSKTIENKIMKNLRKVTEESSISWRSEWSPWSSPGSVSGASEYNSLGSYGSMRKEKEWRRTLACKLFEERHNSEGTEGMDSLWETYEKSESKKLMKNEKIKGKWKRGMNIDEEDEDEDREGQVCCLQALKFSTGKMNLGTKMTKALKGFGWLSRHGSRKRLIHS